MSLDRREEMERRRRLLKAAAGAPAIFTLLAGAPVAAASLTCADKIGEGPDPSGLTPVDGDGVPIDLSDEENAPAPAYYVDEEGTQYYDLGNGQLVSGSCWASLGGETTASVMGRLV